MVERFKQVRDGRLGWGLARRSNGDLCRHSDYEALERQLAEARAERDTLAMHLEAKAILAKRDNARLREALSGACDQILDSYRTWVADDLDAHPKQGQIPRYDAARAALAGKE